MKRMQPVLFLVFLFLTQIVILHAAAAAKDNPQITIRIAHESPKEYPKQVWAEVFKKNLEENTAGKIRVEIYPQSQLYNDTDGVVALAQGALEIFITSSGHLPTWHKRWSVYSFPGMFYDHKQAHRFMDSPCCEAALVRLLEPRGIKVLGQFAIGPTTLFTIKQVKSIEGLKGLKLRSTKNPITSAALEALGMRGVSLGVADTYTALQQGMVDGDATPLSTHMTHRWNEIAKHNLELPISFGVNITTASLKWWNNIPADIKEIREKKAIPEATMRTRTYSEELLIKERKDAASKGTIFTQLSKADAGKIATIMDPIYKQFEGDLGKDLLECAMKSK